MTHELHRNNLLVKPEPLAETTNAGIYTGAMPAPLHRSGEVIAVGDDCEMLNVGDRVLYMPRRATPIEGLDIINEEDDVLYIYDKEEVSA